MKKLARFDVHPEDGRTFAMELEDEDGRKIELSVTAEQLDVIADLVDDFLADHEDEAFAADEADIYQKPLG